MIHLKGVFRNEWLAGSAVLSLADIASLSLLFSAPQQQLKRITNFPRGKN